MLGCFPGTHSAAAAGWGLYVPPQVNAPCSIAGSALQLGTELSLARGALCACAVLGFLLGWLGGLVPLLSRLVSFLSSPLKNRQLNVGFALSFPEKPLLLAAKLWPQRVFALWVLASSLLLQHPWQSGLPHGD